MSDFTDFRIELWREKVRISDRFIKATKYLLFGFNIITLLLIYSMYLHPTFFVATLTGACATNIGYIWSNLINFKSELRVEKNMLSRYEEFMDSEVYKDMLKQLENAKNHYEELIKEKEKQS